MSGVASTSSSSPVSAASGEVHANLASSSSSSSLGLAAVGSSLVSASAAAGAGAVSAPPAKVKSRYYLDQSSIINKYEIGIDSALSPYLEQLEIVSDEGLLSYGQICFVIKTALLATQHAFIGGVGDRGGLYADFERLDKLGVTVEARGYSGACAYPSSFR